MAVFWPAARTRIAPVVAHRGAIGSVLKQRVPGSSISERVHPPPTNAHSGAPSAVDSRRERSVTP